jgi:hypothetical protein
MAIQLLKEAYLNKTTEMKIIPVKEVDIINLIQSFKLKNSSGYDHISSSIIRYCVYDIGKPHSNLYNSSLQSDIYPEKFKYSEVRHVYKTGGKTKMTICRPV